ncbi:MAG: hypothetical protein GC188_09655 [Alphaproteobacteria bacterium]|nr:hypothetical protein [Alphaproteobacteria bacterium]
MSIEESIRFLEQEIQHLGCNATLSLDVEQPNVERLRKKVGSRTGASLQLKFPQDNYVIACDTWQLIEHNIYVLHLAIRQWRNMEKWGIAPLPVLMHGFTPPMVSGSVSGISGEKQDWNLPDWMEQLGLGPTATLEDAQAIYHRRAKQYAQDTDALAQLNIMMEDVRAHFAKKS